MDPRTPVSLNERWRRGRTSSRNDPGSDEKDRYWLHILLFVLTLASTTYVGGELVGRWILYAEVGWPLFVRDGFIFGVSLLLFLGVHEFGHYIAARVHGVSTSLPYFIPLPFLAPGTLGAVIRIREPVPSVKKLFDIGVSGPLAGFAAALMVLIYAALTLPPPSYIFGMPGHEVVRQYVEQFGMFPAEMPEIEGDGIALVVGDTLLFSVIRHLVHDLPPMYELYHYPSLFAGWLALFFTALNLLPIGQLDGGHIIYALFGRKWQQRVARIFFVILLFSGAIGFIADVVPFLSSAHYWLGEASWFILAAILYFFLHHALDKNLLLIAPTLTAIVIGAAVSENVGPSLRQFGWTGWFVWCLLIIVVVKVDHPPVLRTEPLSPARRYLGYLAIVVFILCFSFKPLSVVT